MIAFSEFTYRRAFWFYLTLITIIVGVLAILWMSKALSRISFLNDEATNGASFDHYSVSIEQEGGMDSEFHTINVDGVSEDDTREADAFVSVDFGWPEEYVDANPQNNVLWARCLPEYDISNCESVTSMQTAKGNNVCGMIIEDQEKNILSFECTKRE